MAVSLLAFMNHATPPVCVQVAMWTCAHLSRVDSGRTCPAPAFNTQLRVYRRVSPRREANIWLLLGCFQGILSIQPDSAGRGPSASPSPAGPGSARSCTRRVVEASVMINAFCSRADTSQIITYRCSRTFMWGRQMRLLLSDSGATEDGKPQPGTRPAGICISPDEGAQEQM